MAEASARAGQPLIEVVVPTLDSHALLPQLVHSLQGQSWPHWRLHFIDGPSSPAHREVLNRLAASDARIRWTPQAPEEQGIFGAMNQGAAATPTQAWILFWGSDDWASGPTVFERLVARLIALERAGRTPDLLVCRGRYEDGRPSEFRWRHSYRRSLFLGSTPPHQATLVGPGARRRLPRYADGFRLSADLDHFLQLSASPDLRVVCLDLELVVMGSGGVSGVQTRRRLQEVRRAYRRAFGVVWPIPFLLRYTQRLLSLAGH
ncbi:MAG: glycosyltransferase [Synechococcaceae cyanobacterium]|nr:glycosyltransferase [Synechococcaceae cyanobacterium]